MDNLKTVFFLCWSHKQQTFHIEQIETMLVDNLRAFKMKKPVDFVPIAFADDFNEANKIRIKLETEV